MAARMGPCADWTTEEDVLRSPVICGIDKAALDEATIAEAIAAASRWLYRRTDRKYTGTCTSTTIVDRLCGGCAPWGWNRPSGDPSPWPCPRHTGPALVLGYSPIIAVTSIVDRDGDAVTGTWAIEDRRWLVRTDDLGWSGLPLTMELTHGVAIPADLALVARLLAAEILAAVTPSATCRLPKRTQSATRNGISLAWVDPQDSFDKGRTGVEEMDLLLSTYPWPPRKRARIESGDVVSATHRRG